MNKDGRLNLNLFIFQEIGFYFALLPKDRGQGPRLLLGIEIGYRAEAFG